MVRDPFHVCGCIFSSLEYMRGSLQDAESMYATIRNSSAYERSYWTTKPSRMMTINEEMITATNDLRPSCRASTVEKDG